VVDVTGRGLSRRTMARGAGVGAAAVLAPIWVRAAVRPAASAAQEQEQTEAVLDAWAAAWSSGDEDRVTAVFAADAVYDDVPSGALARGTDELAEWAREYFTTVTGVTQSVAAWAATPSGAAVEWVVEGTNAETGNGIMVRGASFLELADGKIARETAYYDNTAFGGQVAGGSPEPSPATSTG
jgi:steroid delta-isomerase-like uncharacterized protein